ncbi:MAG: hypothetical protein EPN26_16230 [Rhodospirillales bacterium]|nr:MAG: hypothetical protein EPN26_16230 [Rhodospirillales bacterium]
MDGDMSFKISWPQETKISIRSILAELDRPANVGWPVPLKAPPQATMLAPLKVKMSGPPIG